MADTEERTKKGEARASYEGLALTVKCDTSDARDSIDKLRSRIGCLCSALAELERRLRRIEDIRGRGDSLGPMIAAVCLIVGFMAGIAIARLL